MRIFTIILMACSLYVVLTEPSVFAQTEKSKTSRASARDKTNEEKSEEPGDYFPSNEIQSRFRYVIVNDDVQSDDRDDGKSTVPVRRYVQVLLDNRDFTRANLTYLFEYLSNYYSAPEYLEIEIHTSLMTLETLEERIADTTHSKRDNFRPFYKTASYSRFGDGSEIFMYDTGKPGKFIAKYVKLTSASKR